jgi:site-specific recombinase XerD
VTARASRRLDADLLTRQEVERLLDCCSRRAPTGIRNRALIAVMWRSGLRLGEALALRPKDVDLEAGHVVVQRGKGGRRRVVGLDAGTAALIERWLLSRKKLGIGSSPPLFCTLQGEQILQSYLRHALPRLARKAGIEKRVHAHGLRHANAVDLVREGAPLTTVQAHLGHQSAATTSIYLSRIGAGEAVAFARQRSWTA